MSRNVTVLVIILIIILITGYLLWLRSRFQIIGEGSIEPTPTITIAVPSPTIVATSSATATSSGEINPVNPDKEE